MSNKNETELQDAEADDGVTLLKTLLDSENDENIFLFDENGDSVEFEQIAVVPYEGGVYAILRPLDADEDAAAVFKIDTEDEESLISLDDDELASKVLDEYNKSVDN